jgi:hypothetical protein
VRRGDVGAGRGRRSFYAVQLLTIEGPLSTKDARECGENESTPKGAPRRARARHCAEKRDRCESACFLASFRLLALTEASREFEVRDICLPRQISNLRSLG